MRRFLWSLLCVVVAAAGIAGCKKSGGGGSSTASVDIRAAMSALLNAAAKGDTGFESVKDKLAADEFRTTLGHSPKAWAQLSNDERNEALKSCFSQVLAVPRETTLKDLATIDAALSAAEITVSARSADLKFQGPRDGRPGESVKFKARFSLYGDGTWRMITCEGQFGR